MLSKTAYSKYQCDGQMSIFDFMPKEEPEQLPGFRGGKVPPETKSFVEKFVSDAYKQLRTPDCTHCDGCEYRNAGEYDVDEYGWTWKWHCPGTASANWPHGTPMNVSAPLVERDGHYYEDNVVDGIPHIFCWKKAGAKRYLNTYQVKEALEDVLGQQLIYDTKFEMFSAKVGDYVFSFEIDAAEYENQNTKEGDDIISVSVCSNHDSYGKPCDSIEEAVKVFEFYAKKAKKICEYSKHECNKEALWEVADSLDDTECPHVCCRKCATQNCGARCNGAPEPPKVRLWHRLCKMKPEKSGYYEIMDIDGKKGKAWYEKIRGDFDHVTGRQIECWREN